MSYAVAGLARGFTLAGYPDDAPLIPHGLSVILNAPAVFRWTAGTSPDRHREAARALGAELRGCGPEEVGEALAARLLELVRAAGLPDSLRAVGYGAGDLDALTDGAVVQTRLTDNAPRAVDRAAMRDLFEAALGAP